MPLSASEDEFIAVWERLKSASKVAAELKIDVRSVATRRRNIENRRGIRLLTHDPRRPSYNQVPMLHTDDRVEVKLEIENGVVLVGSDCHYWPGHIPTMHRAWCYLAQELKPAAIVINGDAFDGATNSRWPAGWEKRPGVKDELETCQDRLGELFHAGGNARRIWTWGNHDQRFEMYIAQHAPMYAGVDGVHLKDHFPEWTPAWFVTVNEGADSHTEIRHREKGGIHAAWANATDAGINIVTGHTHTAQVRMITNRRGRIYGVEGGMIADSPRDPQFVNYLEGRKPRTWAAGLVVLTYRDGELLMPELALRVDDDHFQFRGEIIKV